MCAFLCGSLLGFSQKSYNALDLHTCCIRGSCKGFLKKSFGTRWRSHWLPWRILLQARNAMYPHHFRAFAIWCRCADHAGIIAIFDRASRTAAAYTMLFIFRSRWQSVSKLRRNRRGHWSSSRVPVCVYMVRSAQIMAFAEPHCCGS